MNKIFLAVALLFVTITLTALSQADRELLIRQSPIELQPYVHQSSQTRLGDFSNLDTTIFASPAVSLAVATEADGFASPYKQWYLTDFPEDPFDGKIEIYVMGEPLPDEYISLLVGLVIAGIIMWKRTKVQPISE